MAEITPEGKSEAVKRNVTVKVKELSKGSDSEKFNLKQIEMRIGAVNKAIADGAAKG